MCSGAEPETEKLPTYRPVCMQVMGMEKLVDHSHRHCAPESNGPNGHTGSPRANWGRIQVAGPSSRSVTSISVTQPERNGQFYKVYDPVTVPLVLSEPVPQSRCPAPAPLRRLNRSIIL
jgi:hypothetical protein